MTSELKTRKTDTKYKQNDVLHHSHSYRRWLENQYFEQILSKPSTFLLETCAGTHSCSHSHPSWQFYFPHPSLTGKISSLTHPAPTRLFPFPAPPLTHYSLSPFTHVNKKFDFQLICIGITIVIIEIVHCTFIT